MLVSENLADEMDKLGSDFFLNRKYQENIKLKKYKQRVHKNDLSHNRII